MKALWSFFQFGTFVGKFVVVFFIVGIFGLGFGFGYVVSLAGFANGRDRAADHRIGLVDHVRGRVSAIESVGVVHSLGLLELVYPHLAILQHLDAVFV